jgi:hypothetical protein
VANRPEEFDWEAMLRSLSETLRKAPPEERAAIQLAFDALLFLSAENRVHEFRDHLRKAGQPASAVFRIEREFADMTEAAGWLAAQPLPKHGTLVRVAGRTHAVWRDEDGRLLLLPSFTPQELDALKK